MAVKTEVDISRNLMIHSFSEVVSLDSIVETIDATLANSLYRPGMDMIWCCDDGIEVDINSDEPYAISSYARKKFDQFGKNYKLALVASEDLAYGMFRVYQSWSDDRPIEINVFRKKEDAYTWLDS